MKRPTIADIAQRAGVTKAAVSFALNGQPGVSAATRERIFAIAAEVGFQPSSAARALSDGKTGAFGLVIDRPARTLGSEAFFMQLISGIQGELTRDHMSLLFTMAEDQAAEIEMYRTWWAQRRVDGVFLVDLQRPDRRVQVLEELQMPAVVLGTPRGAGGLPAIWQDDRAAVETVVSHLAGLGHARVGRVGGFTRYWHSQLRTEAFASVAEATGVEAVSVDADYTAEHGAAATRDLLERLRPPTAILYDNDVMALAGLGVAQRLGVRVPADQSIAVWDDTVLCEIVNPAFTALRRDIPAAGAAAARMLCQVAMGEHPGSRQEEPPVLVVRDSTAAAPGAGTSLTPARTGHLAET
jgi:DNA-binding LacI/PurR family transcriptional regulator